MKKFFLFILCIALFMMLACDDGDSGQPKPTVTPAPLITEYQRQVGATAIAEPMIDHNFFNDLYWSLMCADPSSTVCPNRTPTP